MQWIWTGDDAANAYAEFCEKFTVNGSGKVTLRVGADWEYAAYVNGKLAGLGQYVDSFGAKTVDSIDIAEFAVKGENEFRLIAHHIERDYSVCRAVSPCVAFEILEDDKVLACGGENTNCRVYSAISDEDYSVTPQLGPCWRYDLSAPEVPYSKAVSVKTEFKERERPVKRFELTAPVKSAVCAQGVYKCEQGGTAAERMQLAWLSARRFAEMTGEGRTERASLDRAVTFKSDGSGGIYVIMDLGAETAGYLQFDVSVPENCFAMLGWGEHLADLRPRTAVGDRNFGAELSLKAGRNEFCDDLHRLGCRYIALFADTDELTLSACTLREALYPFAEIQKDWGDRLLNELYAVGKRTLKLCAHVHYEDCPWREQALYSMDSRNQMLFGYGVFGEIDLPRAALRDIAASINADGLPELCPPARNTITIPSFALYWLLALHENAQQSYCGEFVRELLPAAECMWRTFAARLCENGLACFTTERYWNFYEWVDGLDGGVFFRDSEIPQTYDAILTALFALASRALGSLYETEGNAEKAEECVRYAERAEASFEKFYDEQSGLYMSFIDGSGKKFGLHGYTQAVLAMAGIERERAEKVVAALMSPPEGMGECTFATLQWKYDAIMKYTSNKEFCLNEICRIFGGMLKSGATSYWETALGEADFGDAGSLCHAWSAVPCYFMDKYLGKK